MRLRDSNDALYPAYWRKNHLCDYLQVSVASVFPGRGPLVAVKGHVYDAPGTYRFAPMDLERMRLLGRLSPAQRIQVMLEVRELAVGLIRDRSSAG